MAAAAKAGIHHHFQPGGQGTESLQLELLKNRVMQIAAGDGVSLNLSDGDRDTDVPFAARAHFLQFLDQADQFERSTTAGCPRQKRPSKIRIS